MDLAALFAFGLSSSFAAAACLDGANSQERICCASFRRRAVTSRADSACDRGMLYLVRYERGGLGHMKVDTFGKKFLPTLLAMK
ncbi:hypothetical protein C2W62_29680 [Candidatus Entotheonella serta]|nr:hypothetical protein C2W62_29680 [Candidatus Entotheonella serta]